MFDLVGFITKIIDYKSVFTKQHSTKIANMAWFMGEYYHYNQISKLCKKGTLLTEAKLYEKDYIGINIDIWPYDNCKLFFMPLQNFLIKVGERFYRYKTFNYTPKLFKKNIYIRKFFKRVIPLWFCLLLHKLSRKLYVLYNNKKTEYIAFFCGIYNYKKERYKYDDVFPLSTVLFEGKNYNGPNNCDAFLTISYGDYMKLPPVEKQRTHVELVMFDTDKNTEEQR